MQENKEVTAFVPANLSCVFRPYYGKTPEKTGSLGVGFTINKGALIKARKSATKEIVVNGAKLFFPTVETVLEKMKCQKALIDIKSDVPFGSGFGMSGASALGTAYAINELFSLGMKKEVLDMIAHTSEVINKTGLGDIAGQIHGGFLIKDKTGNPISARKLKVNGKKVYYKVFGEIDTGKVIGGDISLIDRAGEKAIKRINDEKYLSLEKLLSISLDFALESKLLRSSRIIEAIKSIESKGGRASMIMLGESVMSSIPFEGSDEAEIAEICARIL